MIQDVHTISAVEFFVLLLIFGEEDFCGVLPNLVQRFRNISRGFKLCNSRKSTAFRGKRIEKQKGTEFCER